MALLQVENISKSFGERKLFQNLSFQLEQGKVYTLLGPNGSGKSTILNILTGFIKADSGTITFNDQILNSKSPKEISRLGIVRTFQDLRLINNLSVKENVLLVLDKKMFHITSYEEYTKVSEILKRVSLETVEKNLGSDLSYGQQKLLTLACCLANEPKLLLLDEPVSGIDKENQEKIKLLVQELKAEDKTIIQVEHNRDYIKETSDFVLYLNNGIIDISQNNN
ncbi:MAG: ATP-binding cassette domain-containing protein [Bacteroidia bacterium]|nr:ATP-binding cassette domain-containing protein [Bacteroidia bacterium]